jgi:spore maturation protein CgeB
MSPTEFVELGWDSVGLNFWEIKDLNRFRRKFCVFDQTTLSNLYKSSKFKDFNVRDLVKIYPTPFAEKNRVDHRNFDRTFDFSFIGQVSSYRDYRFSFVNALKSLNYESAIYISNSRKSQISRDKYLDLLAQSKISINFSESVNGTHQIKLRVWEILLSGSLLLEQKNLETCNYFVDGEHYISFDSEGDLKNKLNYYLNNQDLVTQIALNGKNRAISLISKHDFENEIVSLIKHI